MKKLISAALLLGAAAAFISCGIATMPTGDEWYTKHYYVMQDFERHAYKKLTPDARLEFQKLFWEARDPKSKSVFDERMSYVLKTYKRDNARQPWNCDRARIYLLNGPPNDVDSTQNVNWAMSVQQAATTGVASTGGRNNEDISAVTQEVWTYRWDIYLVRYVFTFQPPNDWRYSSGTGRYLGELEDWSKLNTFGIRDRANYELRLEALKSIK